MVHGVRLAFGAGAAQAQHGRGDLLGDKGEIFAAHAFFGGEGQHIQFGQVPGQRIPQLPAERFVALGAGRALADVPFRGAAVQGCRFVNDVLQIKGSE